MGIRRPNYAKLVVLLTVPLLAACSHSWQEDYKLGAQALKQDKFAEAERYLQAAADSARTANDPDGLAMSIIGLARAHMSQGEYSQAHPLFEQAIQIYERQHGRKSSQVAETLVELSACLYQQHMYKNAKPLCLEAVEIENSLPKRNYITLGTAYNNLAEICKSFNHDDDGEKYYQLSISAYKEDSSNGGRQNLVDTYCNLAMLYKRQARYDMAHGTAELALQAQKNEAKQSDLAMASVLNTLASIDRAQFDNDAATDHYKQAIALLLPHEHGGPTFEQSLCETLDSYADLEADERDFDVAEQTYKQAITHCIHSRGPNHPCVAERLVDLAELYRNTERLSQAEDMLEKAVKIYSASYDPESPVLIQTINDLSAVYLDESKFAEANNLYANWLPKLEKQLGPSHPHVADALDNWALVADKASDQKQAVDLRARAKAIRLALTNR